MKFNLHQLSKTHPIILAGHAMVNAHAKHETMMPAVHEVEKVYPQLNFEQLAILWIAVNCVTCGEMTQVRAYNYIDQVKTWLGEGAPGAVFDTKVPCIHQDLAAGFSLQLTMAADSVGECEQR